MTVLSRSDSVELVTNLIRLPAGQPAVTPAIVRVRAPVRFWRASGDGSCRLVFILSAMDSVAGLLASVVSAAHRNICLYVDSLTLGYVLHFLTY